MSVVANSTKSSRARETSSIPPPATAVSAPEIKLDSSAVIAPVSSARSVRRELIASASAALLATTSCSLEVDTLTSFEQVRMVLVGLTDNLLLWVQIGRAHV